MGRARIISGGELGRYTIELDWGDAARTAAVAKLTAAIAKLDPEIVTQGLAVNDAQAKQDELQPALDAAVGAIIAHQSPDPAVFNSAAYKAEQKRLFDAFTAAKTASVKAAAVTDAARRKLAVMQAARSKAAADKTKLQALVMIEQRQAWCADYTENATGEVGTIDIPGESDLVLIKPGAPAPKADDGQMIAREMLSDAQVFWNAAALPGWQKWKPTYRWGTLSAIDYPANKGTVALAPAKSSAQRLNVNQTETLQNVPIVYMGCNADAFNVGDRVVVEFQGQDWKRPRVIGFLDNPRPCPDWPAAFIPIIYREKVGQALGGRSWWGGGGDIIYNPAHPCGAGFTFTWTTYPQFQSFFQPITKTLSVGQTFIIPSTSWPDATVTGTIEAVLWADVQNYLEALQYSCPGNVARIVSASVYWDSGTSQHRVSAQVSSRAVVSYSGIPSHIQIPGTCDDAYGPESGAALDVVNGWADTTLIDDQTLLAFLASKGVNPQVWVTMGSRSRKYAYSGHTGTYPPTPGAEAVPCLIYTPTSEVRQA